jgi:hypothetical protein
MNKAIIIIISMTSVLLNSCSYPHFYYSPNVQNVPLFTEKNVFSGTVAGSLGLVNSSLEIQTGLSLPGHVALTANYMTGGNDNSSGTVPDYSKIHYFEGTAGFYTSFQKIGVFEIYGGYGKGSQSHVFAHNEYDGWTTWIWIPDGTADMSFSKLFIQPDIGIKNKWIEGAFSCRLSNLNFSDIKVYNTIYRTDELNTLKQNSTPWLLEPAFTFRGGFKSIKVQIQVVNAINLGDNDLLFEKIRFNFGIHFNLAKKQSEK